MNANDDLKTTRHWLWVWTEEKQHHHWIWASNAIREWWTEFSKLNSTRKLMRHVWDFFSDVLLVFVLRETWLGHFSVNLTRRWGFCLRKFYLSLRKFFAALLFLPSFCHSPSSFNHAIYGENFHVDVISPKESKTMDEFKIKQKTFPIRKNLRTPKRDPFPFAINDSPDNFLSSSLFRSSGDLTLPSARARTNGGKNEEIFCN